MISKSHDEAVSHRYTKYFRFNNSNYWKEYYLPKIKANDLSREKLYAAIIRKHIGPKGKVVDLGSGYGFLAKEMADQDLNVTCVDLFDEMLEEARKRLGDKKAAFIKADILDLPFSEEEFDCIVMESVIEHFPLAEVDEDILTYLSRYIKPNGYLFIHVPVKSTHSIFARFIRKFLLNDLPKWAIDDDGDVTHKMWLSFRSYISLIQKHGFQVINYDFRLTRSNARPRLLFVIMKKVQDLLNDTDQELSRNIANEGYIIKLKKMIKSHLALTSYLLFRRVK